ncbi:DNA-directed RNA polymerase subunit beta'-like [Sipha flava]|uniref:DNA-directed RNA polymerase subunit beta'-like n=2 Tax=Sipha flava TaxID=143950 RepID=A0A8B8F424_9HEMI|nr:DNA-directed RNA polymerase subunit beta'-like [Sipha flava]
MYLLKLLVFLGIQIFVRAPEPSVSTNISRERDSENQSIHFTENNSLEEKLVTEVNNYFDSTEKIDSYKFNHQLTDYKCGSLIQNTDVQKLNYNIFIILNQLYNDLYKKLPKKNDVIENRNLENKIVNVFKANHIQIICKHIPRCLDFIYICAPTYTNLENIFSLYSGICHSRDIYISKYDDQNKILDKNENFTNLVLERINSLYNSLSKIKFIPLNTNYNIKIRNETFIKNIFNIINKINKAHMISSSDWYKKSILINYSPPEMLKIRYFRSDHLINNKNRNEVNTLAHWLKIIIFERGKKLLPANNNYEVPVLGRNFIIGYNLALNELLFNFLRVLNYYFRSVVLYDIEHFSYQDNQTLIMMKNVFENLLSMKVIYRLCKKIPLILYYLYSAHITDLNVFSLYLTICSDWNQFLNYRCLSQKANNGRYGYDTQCLKQSINEKLMLNYYMITQKMIYDDINMNNFLNLNNLEEITNNIYERLLDFYKPNKVYIWTSFDWLSSAHIFSLGSNDLNEIREQTVKIGLENIPITMLYNQFLPWNANLKTLIDFKTIVENLFIHKLCQYVKSQAAYIYIYFELTNVNDVHDGVLARLKKSTKWYKSGTQELFKFMESTIEGFEIPDESKSVIEAIENISVHTIGQFKECTNSIKEEYEKNSRFNDILSNKNSDHYRWIS